MDYLYLQLSLICPDDDEDYWPEEEDQEEYGDESECKVVDYLAEWRCCVNL